MWDLGNVLIDWRPLDAVAAGVGEAEARRFLSEFDFGAWNHACAAGCFELLDLLAAERSGLTPHQLVFVDDKAANVEAAHAVGMTEIVFTDAAALRADLVALGLLATD